MLFALIRLNIAKLKQEAFGKVVLISIEFCCLFKRITYRNL